MLIVKIVLTIAFVLAMREMFGPEEKKETNDK